MQHSNLRNTPSNTMTCAANSFLLHLLRFLFVYNRAGLDKSHSDVSQRHEPRGKLSQKIYLLLPLTSLSTFALRFCHGKPSDSLIISPHLQMYLKFASDKAAGKGINTRQINLINNQGDKGRSVV